MGSQQGMRPLGDRDLLFCSFTHLASKRLVIRVFPCQSRTSLPFLFWDDFGLESPPTSSSPGPQTPPQDYFVTVKQTDLLWKPPRLAPRKDSTMASPSMTTAALFFMPKCLRQACGQASPVTPTLASFATCLLCHFLYLSPFHRPLKELWRQR